MLSASLPMIVEVQPDSHGMEGGYVSALRAEQLRSSEGTSRAIRVGGSQTRKAPSWQQECMRSSRAGVRAL